MGKHAKSKAKPKGKPARPAARKKGKPARGGATRKPRRKTQASSGKKKDSRAARPRALPPRVSVPGHARATAAGEQAASAANDVPRRKFGVRGAAPWAARHAAKHAAEARARAAVPPPPGSARATLRVPFGAEQIKQRILELHGAMAEIANLRRNLPRDFFEVGLVLRGIRDRKLYEVRGFGTFEGFLERELDLGKTTSLRLARLVEVFQKQAALDYGMERVIQALAILEASEKPAPAAPPPPAAGTVAKAPMPLPMRPPTAAKR
jgi:hypothetical protein